MDVEIHRAFQGQPGFNSVTGRLSTEVVTATHHPEAASQHACRKRSTTRRLGDETTVRSAVETDYEVQ